MRGRPRSQLGLVHDEVPAGTMAVAARRIAPHLHLMRMVDYDLPQVLANVYLQGCRDMAETLISLGWISEALMNATPTKEPVLEYEI